MIPVEPHIAVVLAAGGSLRLGRAKQLLVRNDETLVHRAVRFARETYPRRLLVVVGAWQQDVIEALEDLKCEVVVNSAWPQGLSSSLSAASRALGNYLGSVLLLGCDQPALTMDHLRQLIRAAETSEWGYAATEMRGRLGSPAVIPGAVLSYVERMRGDHGLATRLNELPRDHVVRIAAPELEFDIDDEFDLRTAVERGWVDDHEIHRDWGT
ncbi:nucleotidyltransferase family protein [Lysobacter tyrosinilyticus]